MMSGGASAPQSAQSLPCRELRAKAYVWWYGGVQSRGSVLKGSTGATIVCPHIDTVTAAWRFCRYGYNEIPPCACRGARGENVACRARRRDVDRPTIAPAAANSGPTPCCPPTDVTPHVNVMQQRDARYAPDDVMPTRVCSPTTPATAVHRSMLSICTAHATGDASGAMRVMRAACHGTA